MGSAVRGTGYNVVWQFQRWSVVVARPDAANAAVPVSGQATVFAMQNLRRD